MAMTGRETLRQPVSNAMKSALLLLAAGIALAATTARAQTIYPIDRAEILVGSRFDLKVEFPGAVSASSIRVTLNGRDAVAAFDKSARLVEEGASGQTAYWIRDVILTKPGRYRVEADFGRGVVTVGWEAFASDRVPAARNVILFIGDGLSIAHRTAARILSRGLAGGRFGGELAIDDMPAMALVSTSATDALVPDSAATMSAYTTGHKTCNGAMGIYCAREAGPHGDPKVETLAELAKRRGLSVGIVTTAEVVDATPAAMVAHTRPRSDFDHVVGRFFDVAPEVILGGGKSHFRRRGQGSASAGADDWIVRFKRAGYRFVTTKAELATAATATHVLGLFNDGDMDGALDRQSRRQGTTAAFPDQPDLTDQTRFALDVLSKNRKGFVLMVESARIDKDSHARDWDGAVHDTIMLDKAVGLAKAWAAARADTLIIVVADHGHAVSLVGTQDQAGPAVDAANASKNGSRAGASQSPSLAFFGSGAHAADDVVLTATGPGADRFHGRIDNTRVFRIMASALRLGANAR